MNLLSNSFRKHFVKIINTDRFPKIRSHGVFRVLVFIGYGLRVLGFRVFGY